MSGATSLHTGAEVLEALRDQRGGIVGAQLLELAGARDDVELVGGAVRDLLLGHTPRELDVVVADDAAAFAQELAQRLNALAGKSAGERLFDSSSHERFRTALVWCEGSRIDVATRRSERYPAPGALPEVSEGTPEQDLERRDFTVNAIALSLGGPRRGELRAVPSAMEDLSVGRLRVLHDGSFIDDPTRLLRLARYRARLGFTIEEHTADLAATAVGCGALDPVSRARIGSELRLALSEPDIVGVIASIDDLGLLEALSQELHFDEETARKTLALLSEAGGDDTRPDLALLAALLVPRGYPLFEGLHEAARRQAEWLLDEWEFSASDRDLVLKALVDGRAIAMELGVAKTPSDIHAVASRAPLETVALVSARAALTPAGEEHPTTVAARRWLAELRHVCLQITGEDLLAAGVPQGPEVGRRLEAGLRAKLDGELDGEGREAELQAAMEA
jgi:tRNA nucleotidyltransferase (CCA-adding enzyme)